MERIQSIKQFFNSGSGLATALGGVLALSVANLCLLYQVIERDNRAQSALHQLSINPGYADKNKDGRLQWEEVRDIANHEGGTIDADKKEFRFTPLTLEKAIKNYEEIDRIRKPETGDYNSRYLERWQTLFGKSGLADKDNDGLISMDEYKQALQFGGDLNLDSIDINYKPSLGVLERAIIHFRSEHLTLEQRKNILGAGR